MHRLGVRLRRFENADARDVSDMVRRGHMVGDSAICTRQEVDDLCFHHSEAWAIDMAKNNYMFVLTMLDPDVQERERIEGCGAVCVADEKQKTGRISTISVMPEYRCLGLGRMIIETLESVARKLDLEKVELSTTALSCGFYEILGYDCRGMVEEEDGDRYYQMEKILMNG